MISSVLAPLAEFASSFQAEDVETGFYRRKTTLILEEK